MRYVLTLPSPDSHAIFAVDENRLAPCADPVSLRQREQWQRKNASNDPVISNVTAPHWQEPFVFWVMRFPAKS
jgi:hypothetical protein